MLRGGQFVGGELFEDEQVIRLVLVEAADHVIAISPGVEVIRVFALPLDVPLGVAVAGRIQPVPAPSFPVVRRTEQPIDHFVESVGRVIFQEVLDLLPRRRQADQVEAGPAQQGSLVRRRVGLQSLFRQFGQYEIVDRRFRPAAVGWVRNGWLAHRLPSPMLFAGINPGLLSGTGDARVGRAQLNPSHQIADLGLGKLFPLGRHLQVGVGVAHCRNEQAPVGIARYHAGAGLAPFEQAFAGVEQQTAFDLLRLLTVAFVAMVGEDRSNPALEKIKLRARWLLSQSARIQDPQRDRNRGSRPLHAMIPLTTLPATSVSRKSRPLYR